MTSSSGSASTAIKPLGNPGQWSTVNVKDCWPSFPNWSSVSIKLKLDFLEMVKKKNLYSEDFVESHDFSTQEDILPEEKEILQLCLWVFYKDSNVIFQNFDFSHSLVGVLAKLVDTFEFPKFLWDQELGEDPLSLLFRGLHNQGNGISPWRKVKQAKI